MPLPIIADVFRVALHWTGAGGLSAINVMHFETTTLTSRQVAQALDANVAAGMWGMTTSAYSVNALYTTKLDGSSATDVLAVSGAKWTGTLTGDVIPAAAALVSLRTAQRGRSKRGRLYLPFAGEAGQSAGVIGSVTALQTAWNTWLTAMTTAAVLPVVASYKLAAASIITSVIYEGVLATQRRRQSRLR